MPSRILREGIVTSEVVNQLSERAEIFYRRLMSVADDYGRYYAHPSLLRAHCFPLQLDRYCEADVKQMLSECIAVGALVVYGDGKFVFFPKFGQQIRSKSKFPDPPKLLLNARLASVEHLLTNFTADPNTTTHTNTNTIPKFEDAFSQTANVAIPESFCRFVYDDWSSRNGKDASGIVVSWLPYVIKRWTREQVEWRSGKHKGNPQRKEKPIAR